jgi:hypothetical protein
MKRRALFKLLAASAAWVRAVGVRAFADPVPLSDAHVATLRSAARLVLPSALGAKGADEATDKFIRWLRGYKAGADMDHGYGAPRLRTTPASPSAGYPQQLADLDRRATARGKPFAKLESDQQRAIIVDALTEAKIDALPGRPNGRHVIADLMAFYFRSTDANDLCYQAAIGKDTCRGLPGSDKAPTPLSAPAGSIRVRREAGDAAR